MGTGVTTFAMTGLAAIAFLNALNRAIWNPSASNIFAAIVAGIFLALSIFSLVSSIKGFLQAIKPVSTMLTTQVETQGAENAIAGSVDDAAFPPNNGAIPGTEQIAELQPGVRLGRYGGLKGRYVTDAGTSASKLSLSSQNSGAYTELVVTKSIYVQKAVVMPWYGKPGLGTQYFLEKSVQKYIKLGFLAVV